ncbi:hypothetical protein [Hymenobacter mucosus]|uniref:Uncharacterized protein n=1 Tax=Hymenobacter mucosus TaxID=1411120 RepID=A0A239AN91_9BACT|nr:hypothetical protein [Hymenobacter mucosus]SNR96514.1 hypothetical protein SAMN06269173_11383 [Hymenobacter mucosus]
MAKSFKQLAAKPDGQKRTSEKDILDFLEEQDERPVPTAIPQHPTTEQKFSSADDLGKTKNTSVSSITDDTSVTNDTIVTDVESDVRQTFIIGQQYLDRLKDYVHTKRVAGQYEYTQKQALHDALDKLFEGATIEVRPAHIRQQEETRKQRIRRGIPK